jgi:hypothetical protein
VAKEKKETDSKQLKERFTRDLQTAKKYMDPIHQQMDKNYEMYRNRWSENDCDFQVSDLFAYTETVVPILTSNRVRGSVHSDYPDYVQHAAALTDILDHTYDVNNWDYEAQEIARMSEIYRSSIAYTGWDADYKNGTGKLCVYGVNIRWCYLDPAPTKFEDSSFFFYVEPKRLSQVIKLYPDKADEIKQTVGKRDGMSSSDRQGNTKWWQSWIRSVKGAFTFTNDNKDMQRLKEYDTMEEIAEEEKRKNSVAYIHYWYRDEDTDEWRVSYWADDVLLKDMENPFWHGCLPYDIYTPTKDILSSMGVPMAEHIQNLNYEKNVVMDLIVQQGKKAVDPPMMYNTAMGIKDPEALKQKVKDGVVPINNPDFVPLNAIAEFFTPPALPNYAVELPDRFDAMTDRLTGVNDSFRGMSEATSGKEVQLKQEAAYTRIKTKVDNFELFNKKIAEKIIVNAMQHYKENRGFRVKGDYTKYQKFGEGVINQGEQPTDGPFEVKPIQMGMDEEQQPVYDRTQYFLYANPNEWTQIEPEGTQETMESEVDTKKPEGKENVEKAFKVLQMTVEIEAGSSLPVSRLARREEALELFQAGLIDQQAVLEAYDWQDRDEIMKRMAEAAKAQQEAQMQAQQVQLQQQMQMKQMELEAKMQEQQMNQQHQADMADKNNAAKMDQIQGKQAQEVPDIASGLDAIRAAMPELQNVSDEELMALVANMQQSA